MVLEKLLSNMWVDFCTLNPHAHKIYNLLVAEKEIVLNDHIALRTLKHPRLGIESLAGTFKKLGYIEKQDYHFKEKKLYAKHYEHTDDSKPKIFISELLVDQLSEGTQKILASIIEQIPNTLIQDPDFCFSGRRWKLSRQNYEILAKESEYAAWVASLGFRPNHFTVFVNGLRKYNTIEKMNQFLETNGFRLNASGGKIKGTAGELLEQSSTMAEQVNVAFDEGFFNIPGCYYEFARRYFNSEGKLYQGFIAASADKIFESTNRI